MVGIHQEHGKGFSGLDTGEPREKYTQMKKGAEKMEGA